MIEAITDSRPLRYLSRSLSLFVASRVLVPRAPDAPVPPADKQLTDEQVRRIVAEEGRGNSHKAIRVLVRDRSRASERARKAEERWETAEKAGRIAPEKDFVIVTGDDAKGWPELQKFVSDGKLSLAKVLELAKKVPELEGKVAEQALATRRADAAKALNWNNKNLAEVLETKGLEIEERDVLVVDEENDGKKIKRPTWCVRKKGGKDEEWEPLGDYAESNLQIFLPALQDNESAGEESSQGESRTDKRRQGTSSGTQWPAQSRSKTPSADKATPEDEAASRDKAAASGIYAAL